MKKYEKNFVRELEKDQEFMALPLKIEKIIDLFDNKTLCFIGEFKSIFTALKNARIDISSKYDILQTIINSGYTMMEKNDSSYYFQNTYFPAKIYKNYLKKYTDLSLEEIELFSFEFSSKRIIDIRDVTELLMLKDFREFLDYDRSIQDIASTLKFMKLLLENGFPPNKKEEYSKKLKLIGVDLELFDEMIEYFKNKDNVKEEVDEKEVVSYKAFAREEKKSNLLSDKEFKTLKKEISEVYDIKTATYKRDVAFEEIFEVARKVYKIYGIDEIKPYFDNLTRTKSISEKDRLKYMLEKIKYYKNVLPVNFAEDLLFYVEMLESDEYEIWYSEIKEYVREMSYRLPTRYEYEYHLVCA